MSTVSVTVEHPGAHEPNGDTFSEGFGAGLTSALREAGLKRGDGFESKIVSYTNTSGVSTVYDVEVTGTEPSAAAKKTPARRSRPARDNSDAEHQPGTGVDVVVTTDEATEKGATTGDSLTPSEV
jgi:hypothetical protein